MTTREAVLADAFNSLLEILKRHELDGEAAAVAEAQSNATSAMPALARPPPSARAGALSRAEGAARHDAASEAEQLVEAAREVAAHEVAAHAVAARELAAISDERATSLTSYELGSELGLGRFSRVVRARERGGGGREVAIKLVDASQLPGLALEVKLLRRLDGRSAHIVRLLRVIALPDGAALVQELLGGGELFDQLLRQGALKERVAAPLFAQAVRAVGELHALGIVHCDVKAENLVYVAPPVGGRPGVLKLIDFGYAAEWSAERPLSGLTGTLQYAAPEVLSWHADRAGAPYGPPADLWSLGVLLFVMLSAALPFNNDDEDEVVRAVTAGDFAFAPKASWKKVTPQAVDVVSRLLRVRPEARATLAELRAHAWIVDAPPAAAAPVTRRASFGNLLSRRSSRGS